jgi:hypothetical protein
MRFLLPAVIFLSGCAAAPRPSPSWREAAVDPDGNVIAFWAKRHPGDDPAVLEKDYGMLVVWNEQDRRFYLFDNVRKRCFGTRDFEAFLREMGRLPRGASRERFDTCCVPLAWKMPHEAWERAENAFYECSSQSPSLVCICESSGLRFPEIRPPSDTFP